VSNGLFVTAMDFGAENFTGAPQWLEINVATNGSGTFTTLWPRQLLTSTPYAIRSFSASNLVGVLPAAQLVGTIAATNIANGTITSNLLAANAVGPSQLATNIGVWTQAGTNLFYSSGYIGIGTNSPQANLHVIGTRPIRAVKIESGDALGTWLNLANTSLGGGGWSIISSGTNNGEGPGQLLFHNNPNPAATGGITRMMINTNGFVGVGSTAPAAPLHVLSDNPYPTAKISAGPNAPYGAFLSMDATKITGGKDFMIFSTGGSAGEGQGKLVFQDYTDGKNLLSLNSSGYVGIGTVFPAVALEVLGAVHARGGTPGPGGVNNNGFMFNSPGDNDSGMSSSADGQIEFYSNSQEVMRIAPGGAVGIGTNTPQAKLHVNGDFMANGKVLMGTGGTNYATDSTESLRIIRGTIGSGGNIVKGSGFTVSHPGTGGYTINFTTAFSDVPTVTVTAVSYVARAGAVISASSVNIGIANFSGTPTDDSFHFIAIGPQ
jgi:hypothetical protein